MAPVRLVSEQQLEMMVEFVESGLATNFSKGLVGQIASKKAWVTLARRLNSVEYGVKKTPLQWKRYWHLLKCRAKSKVSDARRSVEGANEGSNRFQPISQLEQRIVTAIQKKPSKVEVKAETDPFMEIIDDEGDPLSPVLGCSSMEAEPTPSAVSQGSVSDCSQPSQREPRPREAIVVNGASFAPECTQPFQREPRQRESIVVTSGSFTSDCSQPSQAPRPPREIVLPRGSSQKYQIRPKPSETLLSPKRGANARIPPTPATAAPDRGDTAPGWVYTMKERQLALEERRIAIEERRIAVEERRVAVEEKWTEIAESLAATQASLVDTQEEILSELRQLKTDKRRPHADHAYVRQSLESPSEPDGDHGEQRDKVGK